MRKLNKIYPKFMRRLDAHLLENYPDIWNSRIHTVLFWSAVVSTPLLLFSIFWWPNFNRLPDVEGLAAISLVPAVLAAAIWAIREGVHNRWTSFGKESMKSEIATLGLRFASLTIILGLPFAVFSFTSLRMDMAISDVQFAKDINTLNIGATICRSSNSYWNEYGYYGGFKPYNYDHPAILESDQIVSFVNSMDTREEMVTALEAFEVTLEKYGGYMNVPPNSIPGNTKEPDAGFYDSYNANDNLRNMAKAKEWEWGFMHKETFWILGIMISYSIFLLSLFHQIRWQYFLTSIGFSIAILPIGGLGLALLEMINMFPDPEVVFTMIIAFFIFTGVMSFQILKAPKRDWIRGTALPLFTMMIPFAPPVLMAMFEVVSYDITNYGYHPSDNEYFLAFYVGIGVYLVSYFTFLRKMFRRLYALPG